MIHSVTSGPLRRTSNPRLPPGIHHYSYPEIPVAFPRSRPFEKFYEDSKANFKLFGYDT